MVLFPLESNTFEIHIDIWSGHILYRLIQMFSIVYTKGITVHFIHFRNNRKNLKFE